MTQQSAIRFASSSVKTLAESQLAPQMLAFAEAMTPPFSGHNSTALKASGTRLVDRLPGAQCPKCWLLRLHLPLVLLPPRRLVARDAPGEHASAAARLANHRGHPRRLILRRYILHLPPPLLRPVEVPPPPCACWLGGTGRARLGGGGTGRLRDTQAPLLHHTRSRHLSSTISIPHCPKKGIS